MGILEEVLLENYKYEEPKGRGRGEYDLWVTLMRPSKALHMHSQSWSIVLPGAASNIGGVGQVLNVRLIERKEWSCLDSLQL